MKSRVENIKIPVEIERSVEAESAARSLTIGELVCEALLAKYARHGKRARRTVALRGGPNPTHPPTLH